MLQNNLFTLATTNNNKVTRIWTGLNMLQTSHFVNKPENPSPIRLGVFGITLNKTLGFTLND